MTKQQVVLFKKKLGLAKIFTHRVQIFFSSRTHPKGGGYEKTVIPQIFFCAPPPPGLVLCELARGMVWLVLVWLVLVQVVV